MVNAVLAGGRLSCSVQPVLRIVRAVRQLPVTSGVSATPHAVGPDVANRMPVQSDHLKKLCGTVSVRQSILRTQVELQAIPSRITLTPVSQVQLAGLLRPLPTLILRPDRCLRHTPDGRIVMIVAIGPGRRLNGGSAAFPVQVKSRALLHSDRGHFLRPRGLKFRQWINENIGIADRP